MCKCYWLVVIFVFDYYAWNMQNWKVFCIIIIINIIIVIITFNIRVLLSLHSLQLTLNIFSFILIIDVLI